MEVAEVLEKCRRAGLVIKYGSTHHKIHHPETDVWLFNVSCTPSDFNWHWNIKRHFRRLGLVWDENVERGGSAKNGKPRSNSKGGIIDLDALKRAQEAAAAAGEHIPQLDDLDHHPEFIAKVNSGGSVSVKCFPEEAVEREVIPNMSARGSDARTRLIRSRLKRIFEEKKVETVADFVRVAMSVADERQFDRKFATENAGQVAVARFLKDENYGPQLWALTLIEATVGKYEGLQWQGPQPAQEPPADDQETGDEPLSRMEPQEPPQPQLKRKPKPKKVVYNADTKKKPRQKKPSVILPEPDGFTKKDYSEFLMGLIGSILQGNPDYDVSHLLDRLDKLAGITE